MDDFGSNKYPIAFSDFQQTYCIVGNRGISSCGIRIQADLTCCFTRTSGSAAWRCPMPVA